MFLKKKMYSGPVVYQDWGTPGDGVNSLKEQHVCKHLSPLSIPID
jgi:hypothetical protein